MNLFCFRSFPLIGAVGLAGFSTLLAQDKPGPVTVPPVPRFSVDYMDRTVAPGDDFYHFADGNWLKNNPIPPDKTRWGGFTELAERNAYQLREILESAAADTSADPKSPRGEVGNFFASAMDTSRIDQLGLKPLEADFARIDSIKTTQDLFNVLADFDQRGIGGIFGDGIGPDDKNSVVYAFFLSQGGLTLPDRDYYLKDLFSPHRDAYVAHMTKMFTMVGDKPDLAAAHAATVLNLETELAKISRAREDLRDPDKNYNKITVAELVTADPAIPWSTYLTALGLPKLSSVIVGQPEFFDALNKLVAARPLADWKTLLRWRLLHGSAPFLSSAFEAEDFAFFRKQLLGQQEMEPRWRRALGVVDSRIGEALGQLYVEKYFPPEARARMGELVDNLKAVYRDHLQKADWMGEATRAKALAKLDRFTQKIGYPKKFRDYSTMEIRRDDYLGNIQRAAAFEWHREVARMDQPVDKTEWGMTPPTVNAYYNASMNEIVFPAGVLQPPFFDVTMDDAVNYGAIGVVIGHEMTHGYDDQGRKYDAEGNLNNWWTDADAKEFQARAQKVVDEFNSFEALPGAHVNGTLTLGENLADLGGVNIAYDALERALAKDPSKRKNIDGFTPEQRFFISFAQIWRQNIREGDARRLLTVDPHSPPEFRVIGPLMNFQPFYDAFGIKEGMKMWRAPELRAKIW